MTTNPEFLDLIKSRAKAGLLTCNGRPHKGGLRPSFDIRIVESSSSPAVAVVDELRVTSHDDFRFSINFDAVVGRCLDAIRPSSCAPAAAQTAAHAAAAAAGAPELEILDLDLEESSCSVVIVCKIRNMDTPCNAKFRFDFNDETMFINVNAVYDDDHDDDDGSNNRNNNHLYEFWLNLYV